MGTIFSGWYGRRSSKPYFDELPRLAAGDYKHLEPGLLTIAVAGKSYTVQLVRIPSGCMTRPSFICASCGKHCRALYLHRMACCWRCTGAIYRSYSESPKRRAVRAALKVWKKQKLEPGRKHWKPKWQRWPTYERLEAAAEAVAHIITANDCAPYEALARLEASYAAKLNAPKRKRARPPKAEG